MLAQLASDTRLRPLTALRAVRSLFATGDTRQVFVILRAMRGRSGIRNFRRFAESRTGAAVLKEQRHLLSLLEDHTALRQLPDGSLGRAYLDFMERENLSAETLVAASGNWENDPVPPDAALFRTRMREMHDVAHVVTGYGRDQLGELCLLTFMYRQQGNLGMLMVVAMAWKRTPKAARKAVREAWRNGRKTRWFAEQDWEGLFARPLEQVRKSLAVPVPAAYREFAA
jgi:ubiquinone biosynthesis protein COQ4